VNFRGPCFFEGFGAFTERRPRGEDIVDDENASVFDPGTIRHQKGVLDILQALFAIQARLRFGPALPDKDVIANGTVNQATKSPGEQSSLIEASLLQTPHMQGDREDQVCRDGIVPPENIRQQLGKRQYPMEPASKFQLMDPITQHP